MHKKQGMLLLSTVLRTLTVFAVVVVPKSSRSTSYNPWPGYVFTGELRPHPVVSWGRREGGGWEGLDERGEEGLI